MGNCGSGAPSKPARLAAARAAAKSYASVKKKAVGGESTGPSWMEAAMMAQELGVKGVYQIGHVLGKGAYGTVYSATKIKSKTGETVALKVLKITSEVNDLQVASEKMLTTIPKHPNLVTVLDVIESPKQVLFAYDICAGGEVLYNLQGRKHYTEATAGVVIKAVLRGIAHLHANCIAHLDIKPENLVFSRRPDTCQLSVADVRITDYGSAERFTPGKATLHKVAGTPYFCAPEVIMHVCACGETVGGITKGGRRQSVEPYDERCDVFSAGVVAYILLVGQHPFRDAVAQGKDTSMDDYFCDVLEHNMRKPRGYEMLESSTQALLCSALSRYFTERATAADLLMNPWLRDIPDEDVETPPGLTPSEESPHQHYRTQVGSPDRPRFGSRLPSTDQFASVLADLKSGLPEGVPADFRVLKASGQLKTLDFMQPLSRVRSTPELRIRSKSCEPPGTDQSPIQSVPRKTSANRSKTCSSSAALYSSPIKATPYDSGIGTLEGFTLVEADSVVDVDEASHGKSSPTGDLL